MRFSAKNSSVAPRLLPALLAVVLMATTAGAATLSESYPDMKASIFASSLLEQLPEGNLLQAGEITVTQEDFDNHVKKMLDQLSEDTFISYLDLLEMFSLEQIISAEVLKEESKDELSEEELKALFKKYAQSIVADVSVSDEEALAFYKENEGQLGQHDFNEIKGELKRMMKPQKSQTVWQEHLQSLGGRIPIRLQEDWVKSQMEHFQSNPIEMARKSGKPVFVDFSATWCGPCQRLKPIVESLEKKYGDQITILVIDVDEQRFLAQGYGASSFPYLLFYDKDGQEAGDIRGFVPEAELLKKFKSLGVE